MMEYLLTKENAYAITGKDALQIKNFLTFQQQKGSEKHMGGSYKT